MAFHLSAHLRFDVARLATVALVLAALPWACSRESASDAASQVGFGDGGDLVVGETGPLDSGAADIISRPADAADGACVSPDGRGLDLSSDIHNCGSCGRECPAGASACVAGCCFIGDCRSGLVMCCGPSRVSVCVDTAADVSNCGACGNACNAGQTCVDASCR